MLMLVNLKKWKSLTNQERGVLTTAARAYEAKADELIIAKGHADDKKLKAAGVEMIRLSGKVGKAYIETIYKAKWAQNDKLTTYIVDYKKLKSLMYKEPGS